jgi:2-polyprenyl-3-methyl-5-hydroxy-6-metoxy-1,4-benzoquinol methylase
MNSSTMTSVLPELGAFLRRDQCRTKFWIPLITGSMRPRRRATSGRDRLWPKEVVMRDLARRNAAQTKARKAQRPAYDPYASAGVHEDSGGWIGPLPVKVVSVLDLTEDVHRSSIQRGMRVLELGCGLGDVSLWLAKLVGPTGLVVGVDESPEAIDVAEKRATVTGQCYWTRFVTADPNTFVSHQRFDAVVVRRALLLQGERATFLRLSTCLHPDGVIIITGNPAATASAGVVTRL